MNSHTCRQKHSFFILSEIHLPRHHETSLGISVGWSAVKVGKDCFHLSYLVSAVGRLLLSSLLYSVLPADEVNSRQHLSFPYLNPSFVIL